jgi:hypothetical protein
MRYTTSQINIPISKLQGFTSSGAVRGEWLDPERLIYAVYSYSTPIAILFRDTQRAFVNRNKYSVTTSKHSNPITRGVRDTGFLIDNVTADELAELIESRGVSSNSWQWATPKA